jgi:hypothetical protein
MADETKQRVSDALAHCREAESILAGIKYTELTEYEFGIKCTAQGLAKHAAIRLLDLRLLDLN